MNSEIDHSNWLALGPNSKLSPKKIVRKERLESWKNLGSLLLVFILNIFGLCSLVGRIQATNFVTQSGRARELFGVPNPCSPLVCELRIYGGIYQVKEKL